MLQRVLGLIRVQRCEERQDRLPDLRQAGYVRLPVPLSAGVSEPLRLVGFYKRGDRVDVNLASESVDCPRLADAVPTAGGAGDIPRQRPH